MLIVLGVSGKSELHTFEELGIGSINLNYKEINILDSNGNTYNQSSTASKIDGSLLDVIDIWFMRDFRYSESSDFIYIPKEIYELPNIRSFGTAYSLHQAIVLDESGELKKLVTKFTEEKDRQERLELTSQIIHKWTGGADKIKVLEILTGEKYTGGTGSNALAIINKAYDRLIMAVYEHLMSSSHLKELYYNREFTQEGKDDLTQTAYHLLTVLEQDQNAGEVLLADFVSNIHALSLLEKVDFSTFRDVLNSKIKDMACSLIQLRKIISLVPKV